ncbi:hypothetical protein E2562_014515 [Oryza meyeriana var. granulata]|uniref:Uncharacterized protein n=1 Tax=Oryza meyeriana var. granulata TaxID=110450 RepID=A0A6G1EIQ2_9ORYZ|nr:hypothetical protein E2562_014515 [Oryza meyeriana var. granulata]
MAAAPFCLDELLASQDELHWLMEWPPSPYKINVFSSRTGRWEERPFVREGETVTTINDMKPWNHEIVSNVPTLVGADFYT